MSTGRVRWASIVWGLGLAQGGAPALAAEVAAGVAAAGGAAGTAPCATEEQARVLRSHVAQNAKWAPAALATQFGLSEAQVLDALPAQRRVGVAGSAFQQVWAALRGWPDSVFIIRKGGQVFEIHGRVHGGVPSKVSQYFNLEEGAGVTGHLRPDLIGAIHAAVLPGRNGDERGVLFYDLDGNLAFEVYVPSAEQDPASGAYAAFLALQKAMAGMPAACET